MLSTLGQSEIGWREENASRPLNVEYRRPKRRLMNMGMLVAESEDREGGSEPVPADCSRLRVDPGFLYLPLAHDAGSCLPLCTVHKQAATSSSKTSDLLCMC